MTSLMDIENVRSRLSRIGVHIARIVAIGGLFLPWLYMDDAESPIGGPELTVYFWNGIDQGFLLDLSILRAIGFFVLPSVIVASVVFAAIKTVLEQHSWRTDLVALVAIGAFLFCASVGVDDGHLAFAGFVIPLVGLWLVAIGTGVAGAWQVSSGSVQIPSIPERAERLIANISARFGRDVDS